MSISPKARFQQNQDDVKRLAALVTDESFRRAIEYAILSYQQRLIAATGGDLTASATAFHRIAGASEFVLELLRIHEMPTVTERKPLGQLNQNA